MRGASATSTGRACLRAAGRVQIFFLKAFSGQHCQTDKVIMGVLEDEAEWIDRCRAGDPEAFEPLVERYQRMVHSLTYRMTGSMAEADDLAQETFLRAYRSLDRFHGRAAFSTWLGRIAINLCLNWNHRARRCHQLQEQWAEEQELSGRESNTRQTEALDHVEQAVLRLPVKQRAALILTVYQGLNHAAAGKALGCSETTVSWRLFAARRKLRRWLNHLSNRAARHEGS
jgi:RNA polymerase sigma-70 factor, ECF subfamily